jgi:integrase
MPLRKSSRKAERVVRKVLADGTVREYRYPPAKPKAHAQPAPDTIAALSTSWRLSPEWAALADITQRHYSVYLRDLERLADTPIIEVRRRDILALRDAVAVARGNGAATAFLRTASAAFRWAVDRGWIDASPCYQVKAIKGGHLPAWTEEQIETALVRLPEYLRRAVLLAVYTGQRRGDLCRLLWSAWDGDVLRLRQQKTGAELVIPLHPALREEMARWRRGATSTHILTTRRGRPWIPTHLSQDLGRALVLAGLPAGLNVHGLRKAAAARLADAGCTIHEIAAITGHASLAMVQLYTRSADQKRLAGAAITRLQQHRDNRSKTGAK